MQQELTGKGYIYPDEETQMANQIAEMEQGVPTELKRYTNTPVTDGNREPVIVTRQGGGVEIEYKKNHTNFNNEGKEAKMGEQKEASKRLVEYESLTESDKIRAILAAVMAPVSKPFAIALSGIDYKKLDVQTRDIVNKVFVDNDVEITREGGQNCYRLNDNARKAVQEKVDMRQVHGKIADFLWDLQGFDKEFPEEEGKQ